MLAFPFAAAKIPEENNFYAAAGAARSVKACGHNAGIVEYKAVSGAKMLSDIEKMLMDDFAAHAIKMQQPGTITLFQRSLGYKFLRQIKIKIGFFHINIYRN